jgi:hypothetical protein
MGNRTGLPSRVSLDKKKTGHSPSDQREIAVIDERIEDIVIGLYGMTYEEQKIIVK